MVNGYTCNIDNFISSLVIPYIRITMENLRITKAKQIIENGGVNRINGVRYEVKSQSSNGIYTVLLTDKGW